MQINMGSADRWVRGIIGLILLALAFTTVMGVWQWVLGIIGVVFLLTAAVGMCPLYSVFGFSTGSKQS